ncbi:MAG: SDR family oxidoreductase [Polyangiaceae bacterium]
MSDDKDLTGRGFLITGANTGIGRVTAVELAKRGGTLILAGRSEERTRPVLDEIAALGGKASFVALNLGELGSTARAAKSILDSGARLDVLINNAGIAGQRGLTKDGFEVTFGTNHLGPFLFTNLLLPRLREGNAARIVNVSSAGHYRVKSIDWGAQRQPARTISGFEEYCWSKLCNVLFTKELARGRAGAAVHSYSLHPGAVATDIWRSLPWPVGHIVKLFLLSVEEGARTSLHCAASPEVAAEDGLYYDKCRVKEPSRLAKDEALAKKLWEVSEEMVAPHMK